MTAHHRIPGPDQPICDTPLRIVHLSDIHFWRIEIGPRDLFSKRIVGSVSLLLGRARAFKLDRLPAVIERVLSLQPDHVVISGDLTTTASEREFQDARAGLAPLLEDPRRATIVPGNHDRYTDEAQRSRRFEEYFGEFTGGPEFPWLRHLDHQTAILGLDPTRADLTARGHLPESQIVAAHHLLGGQLTPDPDGSGEVHVGVPPHKPRRLIVLCHYPLTAPPIYLLELHPKRLTNAWVLGEWLRLLGPHLYCCGHIHAAWAFRPLDLPEQLCLNAGAPLMHDPRGFRSPGFLEILLDGDSVSVVHHCWRRKQKTWDALPLIDVADFFAEAHPGAGRPMDSQIQLSRRGPSL